MLYHLYQRTITSNGKSIKAWYYWYYDENKKQIRKSCGTNGNPCTVKRAAQAFIESLPQTLEVKKEITFNDFASHMYDDNSPYLNKISNKGKTFKANTLYQHRLYLRKFLNQFGELPVDKLQVYDIDNWLMTLQLSNSVRNSIINVIDEIYKELYIYHLIPAIPLIQKYNRNDQRVKGILCLEEIKALFPDDFYELLSIWRVTNRETEVQTFSFATMVYLIISTGMRSCEIRALKYDQFVRKDAILINAMIDSSQERTKVLKKGDAMNKKWRVVVLPDKVVKMLENLRLMQLNESGFVFEYKDSPVTTDYLRSHFRCVLAKNGIDWEKRNIGIHSLRFTYDTLMKPELSGNDLRLMIGHVSPQMTDYYDRSQAMDHLPSLLLNKGKIDSIFN